MRKFATALILATVAAGVSAQISTYTLEDNNAKWVHRSLTTYGYADLNNALPGSTTDQWYQQWWWIRTEADTRENALSTQIALTQVGANEVTATYAAANGIEVDLRYVLTGLGGSHAKLQIDYVVRNTDAVAHDVALFYYHDLMLAGTFGGDTADTPSASQITVNEAGVNAVVDATPTPTASQVGGYSTVSGLLTNAVIDDLTQGGGPSTGDDGGAFEWNFTIDAGGSQAGSVTIDVTAPPPPPATVFTLTDGDATFVQRGVYGSRTTSGGADTDFQASSAGLDQAYQNWWWYNTDSTSREYALSTLTGFEQNNPNEAKLTYEETTENLQVVLFYRLFNPDADQAYVQVDYTITNTGAVAQTVNLFNYSDLDVDGSLNDSADLVAPNKLQVTDLTTVNIIGVTTPSHYEVTAYPTLRGLLSDNVVTTLGDSGTPFGPGDFTGAFQWTYEIAPAGQASGTFYLAINMDPSGVQGDTNGDGCIDDSDLTAVILDYGDAPSGNNGDTDVNGDGIVDDADITMVILNFGMGC